MKNKRILFVLTSESRLGETGHKTGAYLSEITHPYDELTRAGYEIDFISPLGGSVPLDGVKMDDAINATWMNDGEFLSKIENTKKPTDVNAEDYLAIYFAGGHGAIFDFPDNKELQQLTAEIYENDGVVAAVCHGTAGLVNVKLSSGEYLVKDHEISAFSNEEERIVGMEVAVPFLLESKLVERGALYRSSPAFSCYEVKSGRVVTGQNPASALAVARAMIEVLAFITEGRSVPEQNWCDWKEPRPGHSSGLAQP